MIFAKDGVSKNELIKILDYSMREECQLIFWQKNEIGDTIFVKRSALTFQKIHEVEYLTRTGIAYQGTRCYSIRVAIDDQCYPTLDIDKPVKVSTLISTTALSILNEK